MLAGELIANGEVFIPKACQRIENSNGTALKFADGTLICYKTIKLKTSVKQAWGNIYLNNYNPLGCGNYAYSFVENLPTVAVNSKGSISWCIIAGDGTLTAPPNIYIATAKAEEEKDIILHITAVGKWK